ncbi:universal stress protein [Sulfurivermis fontis]|uniref:universal stress protein n=1 Tax=Sulfurivermis fontis TaxID=1972068 RepID=UPI000FDB72D0|nr:universal stress protein [Sulfurivermis fontis]
MYGSIYLPLDNSPLSLRGVDLAIELAKATGAQLTGSHVYAAKLHDRRFRQMEGGLPEPYRKEEKLVEQRDIHDDLITRGLRVISDSYLDVFHTRCATAGLAGRGVSLEGKNWQALVQDIGAGDADLVVMGALGLGAVESSQLGSVCERVARRIDRDVLVVREIEACDDAAIMVALDGSPQSYGGLMTAFELAKIFQRPVVAVAVFDPHFHYVAFNSIAKVLSPEAASVFRFEEQEKLHEDIIDSGLAKIYQGHLDVAKRLAGDAGIELATHLLAGKAGDQILKFAREARPWLLVLGRIGVHSEAGMDLGSATELLLRRAPCNLLLSAQCFEPPMEQVAETTMSWTEEAEARMARVPGFVQGMARKAIIKHAIERGHTVVTSDVIDAVLTRMPGMPAAGGKCPFSGNGPPKKQGKEAFPPLTWEPAALARLEPMPDSVRDHARLRIEKMARGQGVTVVTEAMVDAATRAVTEMLSG